MTVSEGISSYPGRFALLLRLAPAVVAIVLVTALVTYGLDLPALKTAALWTASWTGLALTALGVQATVDGTVVASETFAVSVIAECLALGPMLLYAVAVVICPSTLRSKAAGLLVGVTIIASVNLVRITSLFLVGSASPHLLDTAHVLLWQPVMALLAIVVWLLWSQGERAAGRSDLLRRAFWAMGILLLLAVAWLGVAREYNYAVAGLASALVGDWVSITTAGSHLLVDGVVGGGPVSVAGFAMQWGSLLLAAVIVVTPMLSYRQRSVWLFVTVASSFLLQVAGAAALAVGLAWSTRVGSPLLDRFVMSAYVVFWGVGPMALAGIWCLTFWRPSGFATVPILKYINNVKGTGRLSR